MRLGPPVTLALVVLMGCQPATISAMMRGSDANAPAMETRCVPCDMRDGHEMKNALSKFDGWRLIYLSEFTTANRIGTSGMACFERPKLPTSNEASPK